MVNENVQEENNMNFINTTMSDQRYESVDSNQKNNVDQIKGAADDVSSNLLINNDQIDEGFGSTTFEADKTVVANRDISDKSTNSISNTKEKFDLENEECTSSELVAEKNTNDIESDQEEFSQKRKDRTKKRFILHDSDSENESTKGEQTNDLEDNYSTQNEQKDDAEDISEVSNRKKKHKRLVLADSDSDAESENVLKSTIINNQAEIYNMKHKGDMILENSEQITTERWSTLCDPESSDEEVLDNTDTVGNTQQCDSDNDMTETITPQPYKKKIKSKNEEKLPKKMTGRDAAVLKKEIKSESQRMVREMNVSLPYHRPKQFTLKEFLSRRPKLSSVVPVSGHVPASVAIQMATKQLDIISQQLEERQKQIREFYKSESESEEENEKDYVPPSDVQKEINNISASIDVNTDLKLVNEEHGSGEIGKDSGDRGIVSIETDQHLSVNENPCDMKYFDDKGNNVFADSGIGDSQNDNEIIANSEDNNEEIAVNKENSTISENYTITNKDLNDKNETLNTDVTELSEFSAENSKDALLQRATKQSPAMEIDLDNSDGNENNHSSHSFEYGELDKEIESFGSKQDDENKINLSKIELLKQKLVNIKPRLSGGPNEIIDLETGITQPDEITKLKERFIQQTIKRQTHKNKVKLNITSVESGGIHNETVSIDVEEDESSVIEEIPGVRLRKLRDELQNQITQKRLELWQNKILKPKTDHEVQELEKVKKDDYEAGENILDDDEEEEMSESSEEEEVEEDEEGEEKCERRKKSAFVDDEAEESDQECDMDELKLDEDSQEKDVEVKQDDVGDESDADDEEENGAVNLNEELSSDSEPAIEETVKKPLKRILKGFTEDSDDDDDDEGETTLQANSPEGITEIDKNDETQDGKITPNQEQHNQTSIKNDTVIQQKSFEFLTPISYITSLQNLNNSTSKNRKESPISSVFRMPSVPSPLKETNWQSNLQKKLFIDSEITNSQLADMSELCSTNFTESQVLDTEEEDTVSTNDIQEGSSNDDSDIIALSSLPTTQELLNVCSGGFDQTANTDTALHSKELSQISLSTPEPSTQDLLNVCSGDFNETSSEVNISKNTNVERHTLNQTNEVKSLDVDQDIISQLIDEEEMEKFKKKFDSPMLTNTQKRILEEFEEREVASGGVIDSDDNDDEMSTVKRKKKNKKKLMFSDDESSEEENDQEEEIDLHDEDENSENNEAEEIDIPADNIGYDSEENEVEIENEDQPKKNLKASDFFEDEAELSESEWGSADEDEKDMDDLEFEQGDIEQFDEKKLRSDLEKIHMRRMLDDDNREVKLLQELLLEDGELHGTGRERQFRWKNIDSMDTEEDAAKKEDDDVYLDEEESEEQWRRKRHEREMFLKEKQKKLQVHDDDDDGNNDLLSDSQLLRIGHQIVQRSNSNSQQSIPVEKDKDDVTEPVVKSSFNLFHKRGSFLSRGEATLQRLAKFNNITTTSNVETGVTAKHSRKFLFQTVSVEETTVIQSKKRKTESGTPKVIKKLRLSENFSPANKKKKSTKPTTRTKLFGTQTDVS